MARTLATLTDSLNIRIHDKTGGTVESTDAMDFFNRAIDKLKSKSEFPGTKQRAEMSLFDGVYEYPIPSGYKSAIDFRELRGGSKQFVKRSSKSFWQEIESTSDDMYADDNFNEDKLLLVFNAAASGAVTLHTCDSISTNGTWSADTSDSDATNVTTDTAEFVEGSGSVNFDISVSQSTNDYAAIVNSTLTTAADISDHEDKSTVFVDVYLPDVTYLTSLTLRWGSSSSNYWSQTVTTQYNGINFKAGWNTIGFAWNGATETGTGDPNGIDYLYFRVTYSSSQTADTDFRIDNIRSILPDKVTLNYYSTNFVKDADGTYGAEFNDTDDATVLEDHEDVMLLYAATHEALNFLRMYEEALLSKKEFEELFQDITNDKPSEKERESDRYYDMATY